MPALFPITFRSVDFSWPDGSPALQQLEGTFPAGLTGLVGPNGSGKSTLLKLIAGQLHPTAGSIKTAGSVSWLPQDLAVRPGATVVELLGLSEPWNALQAIEAGSVDPADFDAVAGHWDLQARLEAVLEPLGLGGLEPGHPAGQLSGGEAMLLAVAGQKLAGSDITLLDEPSNNLDMAARERLYQMLQDWGGTLVVSSHDRQLLDRVAHIVEIHAGRLRTFGGNYASYQRQLAVEQEAAVQAATTAGATLKAEQRQRVEAETKLARTRRRGREVQLQGGMPKILANHLRQKSEAHAGKTRAQLDAKVAEARSRSEQAEARVRDQKHIRLELVDPQLPAGRRVAELHSGGQVHVIQGPERVALTGPNGAGKSTLLHSMLRQHVLVDRVGFLPQRLPGLDLQLSAVQNLELLVPQAPENTVKNLLARLLLRGDSAQRPVGLLSGGELFRVHLARVLLPQPPVQLLVLDEPTNNLDMDSTRQLAEALASYRGALLVVSHDQHFLDQLGLDCQLELAASGRLSDAGPGGRTATAGS